MTTAVEPRRADLLRQVGLVVVGVALVALTLVGWYRTPVMSVHQVVKYPAGTSAPQLSAGDLAALVPGEPGTAGLADDLQDRISVAPAGHNQVDYTITDSDPQRALRLSDAIATELLKTPRTYKAYPDSTGTAVVDDEPAAAVVLVTVVVVVAGSLAGLGRRGTNWAGIALGALAMDVGVTWTRTLLPHLASAAVAALAAVAVWLALLRYADWWRAAVALTFGLTIFRSGAFSASLPDAVWLSGQFGGLLLASGAVVVEWWRDRPRPDPRDETKPRYAWTFVGALTALWLLALVSTLWSPTKGTTASQAVLFGIVVAFLGSALLVRWRVRERITADVRLVAWIAATGVLLSWCPLLPHAADWAVEPRTGRFVGFTSNSNFAGALCAVTIALLLGLASRLAQRWLYVVAAFVAVPLVLTGSRGAILATGVALALILVERRAWKAGLALVLVGAAAVAAYLALGDRIHIFQRQVAGQNVGLDSGRDTIYARAYHLWLSSPVGGHGYRTTEHITASAQTAHNIELAMLVELGAVGACLFVFAMLTMIVGSLRRRPTVWLPAALAGLVIEQFNSTLFGFSGPSALFVWLACAAAAADGVRRLGDPTPAGPFDSRRSLKDREAAPLKDREAAPLADPTSTARDEGDTPRG